MKNTSMKNTPSYPRTLLLIPGFLLGIILGLTPLHTHQYWWHLSIGRLIDRFSSIPAENHFVYSAPIDAPSVIQPWMSQWVLFFLHDIGSVELSLIARNLLATATLIAITFIAFKIANKRNHSTIPTLITATLATIPLALTIDATPLLFALPLLALLLGTATAVFIHQKHPALLLIFPATTILWANLATHYLAPALLAAACTIAVLATTKNRTHLIAGTITTILSAAAIFATPHKTNILLDIANNLIPTPQDVIPLITLALIPAVALIPTRITFPKLAKIPPITTLITAILLGTLAIAAQPLFNEPQANIAAQIGLQNARQEWPHKGHLNAEHPLDCIETLRRTGKQFRVLHPREFAGIIIFGLQGTTPQPVVLLDPRNEFNDPDTLKLHDLLDTPGIGRGLIQQHTLNAAVLSNLHQPKLIQDLDRDPKWFHFHQDAHTTCYIKR